MSAKELALLRESHSALPRRFDERLGSRARLRGWAARPARRTGFRGGAPAEGARSRRYCDARTYKCCEWARVARFRSADPWTSSRSFVAVQRPWAAALRTLDLLPRETQTWTSMAQGLPLHCGPLIAELARQYSKDLESFAQAVNKNVESAEILNVQSKRSS